MRLGTKYSQQKISKEPVKTVSLLYQICGKVKAAFIIFVEEFSRALEKLEPVGDLLHREPGGTSVRGCR